MSIEQQTVETGTIMAAKVAPPITVVGVHFLGFPVVDWVQWATLLYLAMMMADKGWDMWKKWRAGRIAKDGD